VRLRKLIAPTIEWQLICLFLSVQIHRHWLLRVAMLIYTLGSIAPDRRSHKPTVATGGIDSESIG